MKPFLKKRFVLIVGDGPSAAPLRMMHIPQEVHVIGVNHASVWLPRVDTYMTAAPNVRQRLVMRNRRPGVRYVAAVPPAYGSAFAKGDMKGPREKNVTFLTAVESEEVQTREDQCAALNSAHAAFNLAVVHMRARRVALIGVDGDDQPRVSGGQPGDLSHMPSLFDAYSGDAEVIVGSPRSTIKAFQNSSAWEAISWLL